MGIAFAPLSPTRKSCKKGWYRCINTVGMQQVIGIGQMYIPA
jgi:hypothetical protein